MAVSASATPTINMAFTVTDTETERNISETASIGFQTLVYANGTGVSQIDMGWSATGNIPSGEAVVYSVSGLPKSVFGGAIDVNFASSPVATFHPDRPGNRVRGVIVSNTWEHPDGETPAGFRLDRYPYLTVVATGLKGMSGLFNGGSGNIKIMPQSSWMFIDSVGIKPLTFPAGTTDQVEIGLIDSGSGVPYEISIVGTTGDFVGAA